MLAHHHTSTPPPPKPPIKTLKFFASDFEFDETLPPAEVAEKTHKSSGSSVQVRQGGKEALWILLEVMEVSHYDGREGVTWTKRPWNQIDLKAGTMQYTGFNNKTSAMDITYTVNWCQVFF